MGELGWPGAVAVLGVILGPVFMILFRKEISGFLNRVKSVTRTGISTTPETPQTLPQTTSTKAEELICSVASTPELSLREEAVRNYLRHGNITDDKEAVKVLTRCLAGTQLILTCEQIDRDIWGSQIQILEYLNRSPIPEPGENLRPYYDRVASMYPAAFLHYGFEAYMGSLFAAA